MQQEISFTDDSIAMARSLVKKYGLKQALNIAVDGTTHANEQGNLYRLSVWREVKRLLREGVENAA